MHLRKLLAVAASAVMLVAACGSSSATQTPAASTGAGASQASTGGSGGYSSGLLSNGKNRNIVFLADNPPSDPFWGTIQRGATEAAKLFNLNLDYQFTDGADISAYDQLIGTAIATKPAGMAVVVRDPDALTQNICAAQAAGIKVVSYNITQGGKVGSCMSGFIGQDFVKAGALVGQQMVDRAGLKSGDLVLEPVEQPTASYAIQRAQGVNSVLDPLGIKHEIIQAGATGDSEALQNMTQWLIGHPNVRAIIPLGGTPHRNAVNAVKQAGLDITKVAIGGFDISTPVTDGIKNGTILFAVTQEPYVQGFQSVAELDLYIDFGIEPFSINTGAGVVDKTNVDQVAAYAGISR